MITNQDGLRRAFWDDHPDLDRKKIRDHSGNGTMYKTDTRVTWCDWIDHMCRSGEITEELAERATLD